MRNLALKRQKRSSLVKKASWVLYEEKLFNRLIEDVGPLVRDMVEMFSAVKEQQQRLSVEEAQELQAEKAVGILQDANEGEDELLRESIAQVMAGQVKHQFEDNVATDDVQVRYGDEFKGGQTTDQGTGSLYKKNQASGRAKVQYGDHYGKGSLFTSSG